MPIRSVFVNPVTYCIKMFTRLMQVVATPSQCNNHGVVCEVSHKKQLPGSNYLHNLITLDQNCFVKVSLAKTTHKGLLNYSIIRLGFTIMP